MGTIWWPALLVGLTVWLLGDDSRQRLGGRRTTVSVPGWVTGRPGALPARGRVLAGLLVSCCLVLGLPGPIGWALAPPTGLAAAVGLGWLVPAARSRERAAVLAALPETLDLLAASLDAGAPLRAAVIDVGAVAPESTAATLRRVSAQVGVGLSDAEAWRGLLDDTAWGPVARDLARSSETGSAAARVLRQHAQDLRVAVRDAQLGRARAVGVRSVLPLMACFLPAFLLTGVVPVVAGLVKTLAVR